MTIDKFIQDGQDAKVAEKIHRKIVDMLTAGEFIQYISLQKKPAVTILPDSITISNKRIFLCEFTRLGLATNFEIFSWSDIKDIAFKEEIFGSKVTVIPFVGENLTIDYIPKVQARKLYQLIKTALEKPAVPQDENLAPAVVVPRPVEQASVTATQSAADKATVSETPLARSQEETRAAFVVDEQMPVDSAVEDELTLKLKRLKTLYDKQLITKAEYENKKTELLSQL